MAGSLFITQSDPQQINGELASSGLHCGSAKSNFWLLPKTSISAGWWLAKRLDRCQSEPFSHQLISLADSSAPIHFCWWAGGGKTGLLCQCELNSRPVESEVFRGCQSLFTPQLDATMSSRKMLLCFTNHLSRDLLLFFHPTFLFFFPFLCPAVSLWHWPIDKTSGCTRTTRIAPAKLSAAVPSARESLLLNQLVTGSL